LSGPADTYTIPNDGTAKVVEFAPKTTKRLRFEVTDGDGPTLGLSEIEVFPSPLGGIDITGGRHESDTGKHPAMHLRES